MSLLGKYPCNNTTLLTEFSFITASISIFVSVVATAGNSRVLLAVLLRPRGRETRSSVFIYLKRMHEVRRMVATLREIFINRLLVKISVSESKIARALNRMPRISCDFQTFLNEKCCRNLVFRLKRL